MILVPPTVKNIRTQGPADEYIGLGTLWGNPYANTMSRLSAIKAYEKRLRRFLASDPGWRVELKALAGKTLGCHCAPRPCHGDIIVKLFLELWGEDGKLEVSGASNAMGTTVRGLDIESQLHGPLHRAPVRRNCIPLIPGPVVVGGLGRRSRWSRSKPGTGEETSGEQG